MNKWILEKIKTKISLEAKWQNRSCPTSGISEEGGRKRGKPSMRWADSIEEATHMSVQELSRAVKNSTLWTPLIHWVTIRALNGTHIMQHDGTNKGIAYE